MKCPKCGKMLIEISTVQTNRTIVKFDEDGELTVWDVRAGGENEWHDYSEARCLECNYTAHVKEFKEPTPATGCPACSYTGVGRTVVNVETIHGCRHGVIVGAGTIRVHEKKKC